MLQPWPLPFNPSQNKPTVVHMTQHKPTAACIPLHSKWNSFQSHHMQHWPSKCSSSSQSPGKSSLSLCLTGCALPRRTWGPPIIIPPPHRARMLPTLSASRGTQYSWKNYCRKELVILLMPLCCYSSCQSCFSTSLVDRGPSRRTTQVTLHWNFTKVFLKTDYFKNIPQNVNPERDFGNFWLWINGLVSFSMGLTQTHGSPITPAAGEFGFLPEFHGSGPFLIVPKYIPLCYRAWLPSGQSQLPFDLHTLQKHQDQESCAYWVWGLVKKLTQNVNELGASHTSAIKIQ